MRHGIDRWLLLGVVLLTLWGLVMVYSSSWAVGELVLGEEPEFFVQRQVVKAVMGLFLMIIISWIPLRLLRGRLAYGGWGVMMAFLVALVILRQMSGSSMPLRRIPMLGAMVQPSEFARVALVVVLATALSRAAYPLRWRDLALPVPAILATAAAVALQPNMSLALVMGATGLAVLYYAGMHAGWWSGLAVAMGGAAFCLRFGYQEERVSTFVKMVRAFFGGDLLAVPNDQVHQALMALGSGGLLGVGVGRGLQKFKFLAQPHTDFILAIHGEETGLVGLLILLGLEVLVVWRIFHIGRLSRDAFGQLLCFGVGTQIGLLVLIHAAVNLGVGPTTGVPLPFVSYGGSALVANLLGVGLVLAVSRGGTVESSRRPVDVGPRRWRSR
ncbi:MAG: hypothetical protein GF355_01610 [Candidatus Eisenbacteria bacterium]|nr:hypothetical protein [Candidatus Eisenbacteria bacterium]